jgi:hypothetical protein
MPQNMMSDAPNAWRHALWLTILVAASVAFTFGFACAVPFAAFGAATALTLNTRDALLLTLAMWLANQVVGFTMLGYPWDASTFTWGGVLGVVAVLSTVAARTTSTRFGDAHWSVVVLASFAAAFAAYEVSLYIVSAVWMGGTEDFTASIVIRIIEINAAACIGLLALNRLGMAMGLSSAPSLRLASAGRA